MLLPRLDPPISERHFWRAVIIAVVVALVVTAVVIVGALLHPSESCACGNVPIPVTGSSR